MSHFNALPTKVKELDTLLQVCRRQPEAKEIKQKYYVRGYNNNTTEADVVIVLPGMYDIGFKLNPKTGVYDLVADLGFGCYESQEGSVTDLPALVHRLINDYAVADTYKKASQAGLEGAHVSVSVH